jgi:hypothetical protein
MSDTIQLPHSHSSALSDALGGPSFRETLTAPAETSTASKSTHDPNSQMDEEEMEVDLYIEGVSSNANILKRRASSSFEESSESSATSSRKRLKGDSRKIDDIVASASHGSGHSIDGRALVEELAQELECGCCSALVYKPVTVHPCEHFFCGRYVFVC